MTTPGDDIPSRLLLYAQQLTAAGPVVIDETEDPIDWYMRRAKSARRHDLARDYRRAARCLG